MNPPVNVAPTIQDLIQQNAQLQNDNARLQNDNARLAADQVKLVAKMNAISGDILRAKSIEMVSSKVNDVMKKQAVEIQELKEEVKFRNKIVAGCAIASLACLAYVFAPVWVPAVTAKVAWIKLSVIGLL